jgi:hypothetical protein
MFFSEEKNQKTFTSALVQTYGTWPAKSRMFVQARNQKSFGSFLQKRTYFLPAFSGENVTTRQTPKAKRKS